MTEDEWEDWLSDLNDGERQRAITVAERFAQLGTQDPRGSARYELESGSALLARYLLLSTMRTEAIDCWADDRSLLPLHPAANLLASGADRRDVVEFARFVAFESIWRFIKRVDNRTTERSPGDPGWLLIETDGENAEPTGRDLGGLEYDTYELHPDFEILQSYIDYDELREGWT